jgi:ABC-type amino acid transport substrate-binding protein
MKRRASRSEHPAPHSGGARGSSRSPTAEILLVLVATLVLVVPFAGFLYDTREQGRVRDLAWVRVQKTRTLRVGMDFGIPPFAIPSGNDVRGFDADLARDLGTRLGVAVVIVNTPSDALYDALLTGTVDALIAALPVTPEFARDVAYSAPYVEMGERAVVRAGSGIARPADLAGRRVGTELGSDGDLAARYLARGTAIDLRSIYDSGDAALADLHAGDLDAVILDGIAARRAVAEAAALVMLPEPVLANGYVIATKQDAPMLTTHLGDALAQARSAGLLDQLDARWLAHAQPS